MSGQPLSSKPFEVTPELMAEVARQTDRPTNPVAFYYAAIGCCIAAALAGHYLAPNSMPLQLLVGTLAVLAVLYIANTARKATYRWQIQRAPYGRHKLTVTIDETGVRTKTDVTEGWIAWRAVHAVKENTGLLLIFTQPGSAYPVPKAAFSTDDEAVRFAKDALSYWRSAQSK